MAYLETRGKKQRISVCFYAGATLKRVTTPYCCQYDGQKACNCKSHKRAEALKLEIEQKQSLGVFNPEEYCNTKEVKANEPQDILLSEYLEKWLEYKGSILAFSTMRGYRSQVKSILKYMKRMKLVNVTPEHIRDLVAKMVKAEQSPKTVRNTIKMLSTAFKMARDDGLIEKNPAANVQTPKVKQVRPDPFTLDEIYAILDDIYAHDPHMTAFFAIGFFTGMRTGEILALKWENIDFRKYKILVNATHTNGKEKDSTKTADYRIIDIIEELDGYLKKQKQYTFLGGSYLFLTQHNKPFMHYEAIVRRYWKPALKRLGMRYREPYQMRHSFACLMLDAGENLRWIADMLGHTDLSMITKTYGNWMAPIEGRAGKRFEEKKKKAV